MESARHIIAIQNIKLARTDYEVYYLDISIIAFDALRRFLALHVAAA